RRKNKMLRDPQKTHLVHAERSCASHACCWADPSTDSSQNRRKSPCGISCGRPIL
uniref:Uncharacterized protein n=1 Tax=Aegilops tauschii subsp. strangulata TaxID=200361 RepID=A0A453NEH8_AEGTS